MAGLCGSAFASETEPHEDGYFDAMLTPSEGFAAVRLDGLWGFATAYGGVKVAIDCAYSAVSPFSEGLAAVRNEDGFWGFIGTRGELECDFIWGAPEGGLQFSEGICAVIDPESGKFGYIDTNFDAVTGFDYANAFPFSEGLAAVVKGGKYGVIDTHGNWVKKAELDFARSFSGGIALVAIGGKWGVMNASGRLVVPCEWEFAAVSEGMAALREKTADGFRCAIADASGEITESNHWEYIAEYSQGLCAVMVKGKWGFINREGVTVVPAVYSLARPFSGGLAAVQKNLEDGRTEAGYVDGAGNYRASYASTIDELGDFVGLTATRKQGNDGCYIIYHDMTESEIAYGVTPNGDGLIGIKTWRGWTLISDRTPLLNPLYPGVSSWAEADVMLAEELGLIEPLGYISSYQRKITRAEFCAFVDVFYRLSGGETAQEVQNPFTDTESAAVIRMAAAGVVNGRTAERFDPSASITRDELCLMLSRLCAALKVTPKQQLKPEFSDIEDVRPWALDAVKMMAGAGVVNGKSGLFLPLESASIEEAVVMMMRLAKAELK